MRLDEALKILKPEKTQTSMVKINDRGDEKPLTMYFYKGTWHTPDQFCHKAVLVKFGIVLTS